MRTIGTDVSHWSGDINWIEAWDYLPFVYYKATDGVNFIDGWFGSNHDECDAVGMPHAPYHWWQETQDPIAQANHFCDTLIDSGDGYKQTIIDVEPVILVPNSAYKLKQLLDRVEQRRGKKPAIYTSANYWDNYVKPLPAWTNQYDLLCAHYKYGSDPTLPLGWTKDKLKMWQFTDKFWFPGCDAGADGNWFYGSLQECRNWFGNYHPYNPPPPSKKFRMRVTADKLYIRSGPSTSYPGVGFLYKGDIIAVEDIAGQDAWVKHEKGWSCCKVSIYKYLFPVDQNIFSYLPIINKD